MASFGVRAVNARNFSTLLINMNILDKAKSLFFVSNLNLREKLISSFSQEKDASYIYIINLL